MIGERKNGEAVQLDGFIFDHMDERLDMLFGLEYGNLNVAIRCLLIIDFTGANDADRRDYATNIGKGNLESYAKCLAIQLAK